LASPEGSEDAVKTALEARYIDQAIEAKQVSLLLDATSEKLAVLVEIERRLDGLPNRNAVEVLHHLPSDPERGISPESISDQTGLPVAHVRSLLAKLKDRGAVAPHRWIPRPGGGGWELDRWHVERGVHA
jgi:DNA-binding transcriptional ArsR family regulator